MPSLADLSTRKLLSVLYELPRLAASALSISETA